MSAATVAADTLICEFCGADETTSGQPFDQGRLNRHISAAHPDEWEQMRDTEAVAPQTKAKGRGRPAAAPAAKPKKDRQDLTAGIQANVAVVALLLGARSPWKGSVLTSFAPELGKSANASAQAGPDWYYGAWAMAATGGAHMDLVMVCVAVVVCFASENNPKHRDKLPLMRALGMPVPAAPWENPATAGPPPARPHPGPVVVDIAPEPPAGPAPAEGEPTPAAATANDTPPMPDLSGIDLDPDRLGEIAAGLGINLDAQSLAEAAEVASQMFKNGGK